MLSNLNSIILEGNLTRDPTLKPMANGHTLCCFSVASNRYYKQDEQTEQETNFFDVDTWSRLAQTCGEVLKKGRGVRVVGRLKQDRWVDANGKNQSKVKIVAEHVEFKPVPKREGQPTAVDEPGESHAEEEREAVQAF